MHGDPTSSAVHMEDGPVEALRLLAYLFLCQKREDKAIVLLEALRELRPEDPEVLRPLCYALLRAGRVAEALAVSDELRECAASMERGPDGASPSLEQICEARLRAEALWGLGYGEEARRQLEAVSLPVTRS